MLLELAQKTCQKIHQGHQSNNEFYVIYKSGPFMSESRFLEAPLVRQADSELKNLHYVNSANFSSKIEVTLTYKTYSSYSKWWEER